MEQVKVEYVLHYYGGLNFSFWRVVGKDFTKYNNFKTKQQAEQWAVDNGYRLK